MKFKFTAILALAVFFSFSLKMNCQEKSDSRTLPQDPTLYDLVLFSEVNPYSFVPEKEFAKGLFSTDDVVFIVQVGEGNLSKTKISAEENSFSLAQLGNDNFASLNVMVRDFEGNVLQNGDNNYITTFAHAPGMDLNLEMIQSGNDNNFVSHGTNTIGNKLRFNMTGDSKSIIVRNFK